MPCRSTWIRPLGVRFVCSSPTDTRLGIRLGSKYLCYGTQGLMQRLSWDEAGSSTHVGNRLLPRRGGGRGRRERPTCPKGRERGQVDTHRCPTRIEIRKPLAWLIFSPEAPIQYFCWRYAGRCLIGQPQEGKTFGWAIC